MEIKNTFAHRGHYSAKLCFESYYCIYYPEELINAKQQCKTIIWTNGTLAIPWIYHGLLKHFASWGFIVVASWSPFTFIDQVLFNGGLKMCRKLNEKNEKFKGLIDMENLGASGHSQGGGVSLMLARNENVKATVAFEPAMVSCAKVKHPLLLLAGKWDVLAWPFLVFWICFLTATKKVFWLKHKRAGHLMPLGNAGSMRAPACAFFEWHLHNNTKAAEYFAKHEQNFPNSGNWEYKERNG